VEDLNKVNAHINHEGGDDIIPAHNILGVVLLRQNLTAGNS
jgi:hypothetical protein